MARKDTQDIDNVIKKLLFINGDTCIPLTDVITLVKDFLFDQLRIVLNAAIQNKNKRNGTKVGYGDFFVQTLKTPILAKRFLKQVMNVSMIRKISNTELYLDKPTDFEEDDELMTLNEQDIDNKDEEFSDVFEKMKKQLDIPSQYTDFVKNGCMFDDESKNQRNIERFNRTEKMTSVEYIEFEDARKVSLFNSKPHIITCKLNKKMLSTIDCNIPITVLNSEICFSLNWVTSELLAILVFQAAYIRANRKDTDPNFNHFYDPIPVDNYRLALKKSKRYSLTGNFLFGVIDSSSAPDLAKN
uniref:Transcription initiation factor TFIID subunit n=1 Tax=Rhabditophanes sp. KR3021 TaxID=114890 RepID=A0AC35TJ88_9BILA